MTAKNAKKAKKFTVKLDKKRDLIFNFNAFCILSETVKDAYQAMDDVGLAKPYALRAMTHACLTAAVQLKEDDEYAELDLSKSQVGELVGYLMFNDKKAFEALMTNLLESIANFFPDAPESEQEGSDEKGATQTEEEGDEKNEENE